MPTGGRGVDARRGEAYAPRPRVPAFVARLAEHGDAPALLEESRTVTFADLAARVAALGGLLGAERRLIRISAENTIDSVVAYLAALAHGHVVLLDSTESDRLVEAFDPDVTVSSRTHWQPLNRRAGTRHALHPDLALLLSSSGTTGSRRLVRLSHANLQSNAEAISIALGLRPTDRAITTLPLHYCYGLSVLHSHLQCGAAVVLTSRSVIDPSFWELARQHAVTNFAGVPYTFDLLDQAGAGGMALPSLRFVTQAGGRLAPERVNRWAEEGKGRGWKLFVMYGQTEATARMAVLPPEMALSHPSSIGFPVPGGQIELLPAEGYSGRSEGEVVYRGPNVMMGYAEKPEDLSEGATLEALKTGDLARKCPDGTFELIGRKSRFAKPFGLRVDLDETERLLGQSGLRAFCTSRDERLLVAVEGRCDKERVRELLASKLRLPRSHIDVACAASLPRLPSGKPDYVTLQREHFPQGPGANEGEKGVRQIFAQALGVEDVPDEASFVSLGGDSLSWVSVSLQLQAAFGDLPDQWQEMTVREMEALPRRSRSGARFEVPTLLRGLAILLVVMAHVRMYQVLKKTPTQGFELLGGAHVLLAISGYNFARFLLPSPRRILRAAARIALPGMVWIGCLMATGHDYTAKNVLLLNSLFGSPRVDARWYFWFIEALVLILLLATLLLAFPAICLAERRRPFMFAFAILSLAVLGCSLAFDDSRFYPGIFQPHYIAWIFCAGWAAHRAGRRSERLALTAVVLLTVPTLFHLSMQREAVVAAGLLLLIWVRDVPLPRHLGRGLAWIADSSLAIYLTHFVVLERLVGRVPSIVVIVASVALGVLVTMAARISIAEVRRVGSATPRKAGSPTALPSQPPTHTAA